MLVVEMPPVNWQKILQIFMEKQQKYIQFLMGIDIQCSPFMLCLGSIGLDYFISELCYKGTILQRN